MAWAFYLVLVGITAVAAYIDLRRAVVPKWLTVTTLVLGLVCNVVRGAWLGSEGLGVWRLATGPWLGALDGLLFGLAGAAVAFGLFFVLWILGTCGGGDVKLFTALGGWLGPGLVIGVLGLSLLVLLLMVIGKVMVGGLGSQAIRNTLKGSRKSPQTGRFRVTYALPVAIATALVLLWVFRVDLQLAAPGDPATPRVEAHAR
jgi:prepilin peptidase CpaA